MDKRLGSQAGRLWSEIVLRRYDYGRPWRNAKRFAKVRQSDLLAFYDRFLALSAPDGRRLATHVFAAPARPPTLAEDSVPDEFWPELPDYVSRLTKERES